MFECDKCGACCRHLIVEIMELDVIREPRLISLSTPFVCPQATVQVDQDDNPVEEEVVGFGNGALLACGPSHPCGMLGSDNLCAIYLTRPNCCVAFRAGSEQCQMARDMARLPPLQPKG